MEKILMTPPGGGEPVLVEATPEALVPLMVQGYTQTTQPPAAPAQEGDE